jgi:hypothetical protein
MPKAVESVQLNLAKTQGAGDDPIEQMSGGVLLPA